MPCWCGCGNWRSAKSGTPPPVEAGLLAMQAARSASKPRGCHRRQACSHRFCSAHKIRARRVRCGSGLARDAGGKVWQANRGDAIAGKPAPTGFSVFTKSEPCRVRCGSGLARDAGGKVWQANRGDAIAGKPAPTGFSVFTKSQPCRVRCGSGLARDSSDAVCQANRGDAIAGKPAHTGFSVLTKSEPCRASCGSGLTIAVVQALPFPKVVLPLPQSCPPPWWLPPCRRSP